MFANCQFPGMNIGLPDTMITAVPVPPIVPGINISLEPMGVPFVPNVLFMGGPAHTLATVIPASLSIPVPPGVAGISGTVCGPTERVGCAPNVLILGMPSTRFLIDQTLQNTFNCIGRTILPSQFRVLVL